MVRIRKTETSSGDVSYYCGTSRISEEVYEALRVNAKCRPKKRCRAITNANTQCKNCVSSSFTYWCKLHETMNYGQNVPFVIPDSSEETEADVGCQKEQCEVIFPNGTHCPNVASSSNKQCPVHGSSGSENDNYVSSIGEALGCKHYQDRHYAMHQVNDPHTGEN